MMRTVFMHAVVLIITTHIVPQSGDASPERPPPTADVLVILGAAGAAEYRPLFDEWTTRWETAAETGGASFALIGGDEDAALSDHEQVKTRIAELAAEPDRPLWLVLIGHGTFDGRAAKFNLRGVDLTAEELAAWLSPLKRPVALINCSSSSAPFLSAASAENRVIITATKNGFEINFARFGDFLSAALTDAAADLDRDGQVSLLEAFLKASRRTQEHYETDGRLPTEHALLDDDGDGRGTRAAAFSGVRPVRDTETGGIDGRRAHQWHLIPSEEERALSPELRRQRDELELALIRLRERKTEMEENAYYAELESLLVKLARLYDSTTSGERGTSVPR